MDSVVKLNRKLGVGGRGVVYEGFDHAKGHFVAVKEMAYMEPSTAGEEEDTELAEILSELACMRAAQHPNLVQYYGARRSAVGVQIIMEYVSGGSLDYVLTRCGPLRESVARAYTRDVLAALQYLHEVMHVCHRDVKPANILITPEGRCKLADFGVAKHVEEGASAGLAELQQEDGAPSHSTPHSGDRGAEQWRGRLGVREGYLQTAVGTPWYMAPEVINGGVEDDEEAEEEEEEDELGHSHSSDVAENRDTLNQTSHDDALAVRSSGGAESSLEDWSNMAPAATAAARAPSGRPSPPSPPPLYSSTSYYNPLKRILRKGRLRRGVVGYTTRADIWSVGVTVYEMVTGTRPFGADLHNPSAVMFRIANCATAPPRLPADMAVSPTLQNFLDLCFVYDKELRATARELLGHPWLRGALPESATLPQSTEAAHATPCPSGSAYSSREANSPHARPPNIGKKSVSSSAAHHASSQHQLQPQQPCQHSTQHATERRSVFDGVALLDALDLPAYAAPSPSASLRENSKSTSHRSDSNDAGRAESKPRSRPTLQRLSSAGQPQQQPQHAPPLQHAFPAVSAATTVEASLVSPAERAEASSRYAAARQRIGGTRNSAPRTPASSSAAAAAAAPRDGHHGSGVVESGGLRTKYGAFVDLLSQP